MKKIRLLTIIILVVIGMFAASMVIAWEEKESTYDVPTLVCNDSGKAESVTELLYHDKDAGLKYIESLIQSKQCTWMPPNTKYMQIEREGQNALDDVKSSAWCRPIRVKGDFNLFYETPIYDHDGMIEIHPTSIIMHKLGKDLRDIERGVK
jgi:hypothetical protein